MPDHEAVLLSFIDRLLAGALGFDDFSRQYYDYYIETVPDGVLAEDRRRFFYAAQERLDWTAEDLDEESRGYGWSTPAEYVAWLRDARDAFGARFGP